MILSKIKVFALILIISTSFLSAQVVDDMSDVYKYDSALLDSGCIYHYVITVGKKQPFDYWLYTSGDLIVATLYDSSLIDGAGIVETHYLLDEELCNFSKSYSTNLFSNDEKQWINQSRWYDMDNNTLRIVNLYNLPSPNDRFAYRQDIPFSPTVMQVDLGLYFSVFFRFLKSPFEPFTLCYDSFGHQIFMGVEEDGEEIINGIDTVRYKVWGEGLWSRIVNQGGYVWIAREDSHKYMVKHTMTIGWSWQMRSFSIDLLEILPGGEDAWMNLQKNVVENREIEE